jgi:DNA-directed RNA polymerase
MTKTEKHNILVAGSNLEKFINKDNIPLLYLPSKIPMIVPPKPYEKVITNNKEIEILGGYLLNDQEYTDSLIKQKWDMSVKTTILKNNIIYNMVNNINSVAFKINTQVLDFILSNYKKYELLIDPNFIHPLTLKEKLNYKEKIELESFFSIRDLEQNILGLANIYRYIPNFYLPIRLDFRGRINCISEYLNYQGNELAKALLLFANGEKVLKSDTLSINYLKIFGANCFGNKLNKSSFVERIKWVEDNIKNIIEFKNGKLISQADNKLLFIAFCFEFNNYLNSLKNDSTYFITHLPVQFDASCNGFQHLTLLIRDLTLSEELNLSNSKWTDTPKDFYSFVLLKMKEFFTTELENNLTLTEEEKESYIKLISLGENRSLVKKIIMTIPYNATTYAIVNYMKENFNFIEKNYYSLKSDPKIIFKEIDFQLIRKALTKVLYRDYTGLQVLIIYLKEIASISTELNIQIPWILPSGLIVQQKYNKSNKIKLKPYLYSKDIKSLNSLDKKN